MINTAQTIFPMSVRVVILTLFGWLVSIAFSTIEESRPQAAITKNATLRRIITLSPATTEMVFALGLGERIVAVSNFCNYPPEVTTKERVGGYFNPNLEKILAMRADCVIAQDSHPKLVNFCEQHKIRLTQITLDTIDSVYQSLRVLGWALGCSEQAEKLRSSIKSQIEGITKKFEHQTRTKIFFCFNRRPGEIQNLYTINGQGFLGELLDRVGGENIYSSLSSRYQKISRESLIKGKPDVIIEVQNDKTLSEDQRQRLKNDWRSLVVLPAVKNNRIYILTDDYLLLPGPRIPHIAERLAGVIHGGFDQ